MEGEHEKVDVNKIIEVDITQFEEEDLIKLEELFKDNKKSPTKASYLINESAEMQLLISR